MATTTEHITLYIEQDVNKTSKEPQLAAPSEEIEVLLDEINGLEGIKLTQQLFTQIKADLNETIESMENHRSFLSKVALFWGKLPLWQKILGGLILTVPFLIIGIAAHISFLLAFCAIAVVIYAGVGILLDNHNKFSSSFAQNLRKGIFALAGSLEKIITILDTLRQKFAIEIDKFKTQNEQLKKAVVDLQEHVTNLAAEIKAAAELTASLSRIKDESEQTTKKLEATVTEQAEQLGAKLEELDQINKAYAESQNNLAQKLAEFTQIKTDLSLEIEKTKNVAEILHDAVAALTNIAIPGKEQQQIFNEKFDEFLKNNEATFDQVANRFSTVQVQLELRNEQLIQSEKQYKELLNSHLELLNLQKDLMKQMEAIFDKDLKKQLIKFIGQGSAIAKHGVFAQKQLTSTKTNLEENKENEDAAYTSLIKD